MNDRDKREWYNLLRDLAAFIGILAIIFYLKMIVASYWGF